MVRFAIIQEQSWFIYMELNVVPNIILFCKTKRTEECNSLIKHLHRGKRRNLGNRLVMERFINSGFHLQAKEGTDY